MFAEIERDRQFQIVDKLLTQLVTRVLNVANNVAMPRQATGGEEMGTLGKLNNVDSIKLWLDMSFLKNGLENWRHQMLEMIGHVDELSESNFGRQADIGRQQSTYAVDSSDEDSNTSDETVVVPGNTANSSDDALLINEAGNRIKRRLMELVSEYNEKIRACTTMIEGMTLATHMVSQSGEFASEEALY